MKIYSLITYPIFFGERIKQSSDSTKYSSQKQLSEDIPHEQRFGFGDTTVFVQNETELRKNVTDYDSVIDFLEANNSLEETDEYYGYRSHRIKQTYNRLKLRTKTLTLEQLKSFHENSSIEDILEFHTSKNYQGQNPFIRIYKRSGKMFSIDSYVKELFKVLKDYPDEIAKIITTKDFERNIMPVMFLSRQCWDIIVAGVFKKADNKYLTLVQKEITDNLSAYNLKVKNLSMIQSKLFGDKVKTVPQEKPSVVIENIPPKPMQEEIIPDKNITPAEPMQKEIISDKNITPVKPMQEEIIPDKNITLSELSDYMKKQKELGNVLWSIEPYKNLHDPILFTIADKIAAEEDKSVYENLLAEIEQDVTINFDIKNKEGIPFFAKLIMLQNEDLINVVKDKKIKYHPLFDDLAENIDNELLISKLKECNIVFEYINNAAKNKSPLLKNIFASLNSIFYTREKSGKYVFDMVLSTKDSSYIYDFWKHYRDYIPKNSTKIMSKFLM